MHKIVSYKTLKNMYKLILFLLPCVHTNKMTWKTQTKVSPGGRISGILSFLLLVYLYKSTFLQGIDIDFAIKK